MGRTLSEQQRPQRVTGAQRASSRASALSRGATSAEQHEAAVRAHREAAQAWRDLRASTGNRDAVMHIAEHEQHAARHGAEVERMAQGRTTRRSSSPRESRAARPKAVSQTQHGTATTHTPHDQAMARASGSTGAPSLLATQRSHDANRRVYEEAMNASYAAHEASKRPDPEDSMQPHQYHERAMRLHRAAAEHATRVGDAAQAAVHQRELARHELPARAGQLAERAERMTREVQRRQDAGEYIHPHELHDIATTQEQAGRAYRDAGSSAMAAWHEKGAQHLRDQANGDRLGRRRLSAEAYSASQATHARHQDPAAHEAAQRAHLAAARAHRLAGDEVQARSHELAAAGHAYDAGSARGTSRDRALPSDPADVRGARRARAAAPAARTPLPVQQGKKGGTFVLTKSGKKRYVKKA